MLELEGRYNGEAKVDIGEIEDLAIVVGVLLVRPRNAKDGHPRSEFKTYRQRKRDRAIQEI